MSSVLTRRVRPYSCFLQVTRKQEKDEGTETMRKKHDKEEKESGELLATNLVKLSRGWIDTPLIKDRVDAIVEEF